MPSGEINLQEPPVMPETQPAGMKMRFVSRSGGKLIWVMLGLMVVAMGGMMIGQIATGGADRKQKLGGDRRDYLRYLAQNRKRVRQHVSAQREASAWQHPD